MILRRVNLDNPEAETVDLAASVVSRGGIVLSPTDTVYGLACNPFDEAALKRLISTKARSASKGFLLLVPGAEWIPKLASDTPELYGTLAPRVWPGPVTMLLKPSPEIPGLVCGSGGKVGFRVPDCDFLIAWLKRLSSPLASTSANRSGAPQPQTVEELKSIFENEVDLFLDGGPPRESLPSTVVDLTEVPPRIVRRGTLASRVEEFF